MRFLMLYKPDAPEGLPPSPEDIANMEKFIGDISRAGVLLAALLLTLPAILRFLSERAAW